MIRGKAKLIEHFEYSEFPYWYVYADKTGKSGGYIATSSDDDNLGMERSKEDLIKAINRLSPGTRYYITFKKSPSMSRGFIETTFEIEPETLTNTPAINGHSYSHEDIETMTSKKVTEALAQYKRDQEHEETKKKLADAEKELRRNKPGVIESRIAGFMDQYPQIMHGLFGMIQNTMTKQPATVRVSGFENHKESTMPQETNNTENNEHQERLEKALTMWEQADPDFLTVLEKIAHLASSKKDAYNSYKPFLLSM